MDTVTYPDPKVREAAKGFVCIRVGYDHAPELVMQYGVKGLPDLRFLDPDGKETSRLRGFASPSRLVEALQGGTGSSAKTEVREVAVTPEAVAAAVKKGVAFLQGAQAKGCEDEILYALAVSGIEPSRVPDAPLTGTYQAAFRALALSRLAHKDALQACATFLVDAQLANGQWTYGRSTVALGDSSNTAYALLGLAACRKAGIEVPPAVFEKTQSWWLKSRNPDGGWGYRSDRETESYASMTESGLSSLLLCGAKEPSLEWLKGHFSVRENLGSPYQQGRLLYHLYALERVGSLLGTKTICGHDWYREGAAFLLGTQRPDGSWDDGADTPIPNTCFALLFLKRATEALR